MKIKVNLKTNNFNNEVLKGYVFEIADKRLIPDGICKIILRDSGNKDIVAIEKKGVVFLDKENTSFQFGVNHKERTKLKNYLVKQNYDVRNIYIEYDTDLVDKEFNVSEISQTSINKSINDGLSMFNESQIMEQHADEFDQLGEKVKALQKANAINEGKQLELLMFQDKLQIELKEAQDKVIQNIEISKALEEKLAITQKQYDEKCTEVDKIAAELKDKKQKTSEEIEILTTQLSEAKEEKIKLADDMVALQDKIGVLDKEIDDKNNTIVALNKDKDILGEQLKIMGDEKADLQNKLTAETEAYNKAILEKENEISTQKANIETLVSEKEKLNANINDLEVQYNKTSEELQVKVDEIVKLQSEYKSYKENNDNTQKTMNAETEKLKSQLNAALKEAKVLRGKLSEVEQANGKLKNDIIALNNQIATLKAEVEKLMLQSEELHKHLQNMTIERDNQKVRADQGDNQVSALKQELNKAIGEWEKFRKYSMELEVQVQDLKKKYLAKVWKFKGALNRLNHTVHQKRLRINRINFELVIPQSGVLNSVSFVIGSKKDTRPVYGCQYGCHIFDTYFNNKHVGHFVINELEDYHYPHHWHGKKHSLHSSVQNLNMVVHAGDKIPISVQGDLMLLSNEVNLCNLHDYEINMNFSRNHVI